MSIQTTRPKGLVPGSVEWFKEAVGPKLLQRLHDEIEAQPVGAMNPTGARLLSVGLSIVYPTVSAVHHTVETTIAKTSTVELEARLLELARAHQMELQNRKMEDLNVSEVDFVEVKPDA